MTGREYAAPRTADAPFDRVLSAAGGGGTIERNGRRTARVRCGGHLDRRPSCDLVEAEDGKVLVRCRSYGCSVASIVAGWGLSVRDLFPALSVEDRLAQDRERLAIRKRYRRTPRKVAAELLERNLARERSRLIEALGHDVALTSREINAARNRVAALVGQTWDTILPFPWEGTPFEYDVLTPMLYRRALEEVARERWERAQLAAVARFGEQHREAIMRGPVTDPNGPQAEDRTAALDLVAAWFRAQDRPRVGGACRCCGYFGHKPGAPVPFERERLASADAIRRFNGAADLIPLVGPVSTGNPLWK